jgi:hypothetical protein
MAENREALEAALREQNAQVQRQRLAGMRSWKEFLESTPAYSECRFENLLVDVNPSNTTVTYGIRSPRIQLYCEIDDGVRSFSPDNATIWCGSDSTTFVGYTCRDCGQWSKTYAILFEPDQKEKTTLTAMKLGEFPPFGSHIAKRLQGVLSKEDLELYRKGLRCEREGHGIGAAAYFRRVVDNHWKALVRKLRDAAEKLGSGGDQLRVFDDALSQQQFSAAVDMLKDAIPPKLLILDGRNPLTLLYKPLSIQLHDLTDEQCLQQAADIRVVLNELFDNITRVLRDDEALKGAVTRLQG